MTYLTDLAQRAKSFLDGPAKGNHVEAVVQDRYDKRLWAEILAEVPPIKDLVEELNQRYDYTDKMIADVLNQFWQSDPRLRSQAEMDAGYLTNHAVSAHVASTPETVQTRAYTQHAKYGAAMATISVGQTVRDFLASNKDLHDQQQKARDAQQQQQDAQQQVQEAADALGDAAGEHRGEGPLTQAQATAAATLEASLAAAITAVEVALVAAQDASEPVRDGLRAPIRKAVIAAGNELADEAEMMRAWGVNAGELQQMSFQERADLAKLLRGSRLHRFRALIGRFLMMAAAQRSRKVEFARDEVYSTEMSDRLPDVLGGEFAHLINRHTRLDFLQRLAEGQLLSRKYRGVEKVGQGAIIFICDNSQSMTLRDKDGVTREAWAKAFMLAMLDQARVAKRDFVGINFSSETQQKVWRFPAGKSKITDVISMTEHFFSGGTDVQRPLDLAMDILEKEFNDTGKTKADLCLVTDDECHVTPHWQQQYLARKQHLGFRTFGVAVGMAQPGGTLSALSDNVRSVQSFTDPMSVADILRIT